MNDIPQVPAVTRRQLLKMLGLTGAAGAVGVLGACSADATARASKPAGRAKGAAKSVSSSVALNNATKHGDRSLVVIEFEGGNDGFATLIPYGDGRFRKLRDRIWVDPKNLSILDERYALPKGLEPLKSRLAFVEGVGVAHPDLSHFAMAQRWWTADPEGTQSPSTGFLGRCCDAVHRGEAVGGVSVGGGSAPIMIASKASTVSLPQLDMVRDVSKAEPSEIRMRSSLASLVDADAAHSSTGAGEEADRYAAIARSGIGSGLELLGTLTKLGDRPKRYPDTELGKSLALVRQLITLDVGMRVFHVPFGGFDTHTNQNGTHDDLMNQFGLAVGAFLGDLDDAGLSNRVLVATVSEFGRRAESNAGGTDHGTASTVMLAGPVQVGRHGTAPDLRQLDQAGNVKATVSMTDYYATLVQDWLGVPAGEVLPKGSTPIGGLLKPS